MTSFVCFLKLSFIGLLSLSPHSAAPEPQGQEGTGGTSQPWGGDVLKLCSVSAAGFLGCLSGWISGIDSGGPSHHSKCFTLKPVVLSAPLGTFGREVSGKPMAAGSGSPLSTTTISSSPVPWWCCWPSSCTFCESTEFTADKLEPRLRWTCCGLNKWCR